MKISLEDVENVAKLAKLTLKQEEKGVFARQLSDVLVHIDNLSQIDTKGVEPFTMQKTTRDQLREDEPCSIFCIGDVMANAPEKDKGHFKVPKIIE